ncbi:N-acetyltransferase family protein [Streptomyces sp. bgisy100]|uniref:GNAT family N-acetyltransferase n=1 Tax=Streptomyces sp. bgisy100 TaxID=3413783 RepID=UPI003D710F38
MTGTPLRIRPATPGDADAVAGLHRRARATYYRGHVPDAELDGPAEVLRWHTAWGRAIAGGERTVLCAVRDGRVTAVASFGNPGAEEPGTVLLYQFHTDPGHWRQGIGGALHDACTAAWREAGAGAARLEVYRHNLRARAFYERHGWQPEPPPAPGGTHLRMRLELPDGPGAETME